MTEQQNGWREYRESEGEYKAEGELKLIGVILSDVAVDILDDTLKNKLLEVAIELPFVEMFRVDVQTL